MASSSGLPTITKDVTGKTLAQVLKIVEAAGRTPKEVTIHYGECGSHSVRITYRKGD